MFHICMKVTCHMNEEWSIGHTFATAILSNFQCPQGFCIEVNDDTEMKLVTQLRWLPAHACIKNMVIKDLL